MESAPSPYLEIDPALQRWVEKHSLTLCREWQGEARFWYTSRGKECFQVAIDPPKDGAVKVRASAVETDDAAELHGEWVVASSRIDHALAAATGLIDLWSVRTRTVR
jgi:hypothetical protein